MSRLLYLGREIQDVGVKVPLWFFCFGELGVFMRGGEFIVKCVCIFAGARFGRTGDVTRVVHVRLRLRAAASCLDCAEEETDLRPEITAKASTTLLVERLSA